MAQPFDLEVQQIQADCSIGISVAPNDGVDPDQLLKNADMALYVAKTNGRRAFQFFERQMDAQVKARRRLELDIKAALLEGEFELYYQPIVNLQSDRVSCCEALLRWHHPDRGMVLPGEFIAAAEEHGLIAAIGEWVLRTACTEAATWPDNIRVAVNVSPIQLMNRNWVETVVSVLATSGLPAPRLELELTEQALLSESDTILANLRRLRELGVRLVMDDFGVGFCSLNYLRRFPFDVIKFDRSFIKDIPDQGDAVAIVRAVAGLARSLGMTTTAEGVETQQQLDEIRALGCTDMQGYLFSVPRPVGELSQLLMPRVERKANAA
jgi:predicted signal transduction protein with EAL and GGDEF domain